MRRDFAKNNQVFCKDELLALLIDRTNLHGSTKALGFDIDFKLLPQKFMRCGRLLCIFYHTALL